MGKQLGMRPGNVQSGIIDLGSCLSVTNPVIARPPGAVMVNTITRVTYPFLPLAWNWNSDLCHGLHLSWKTARSASAFPFQLRFTMAVDMCQCGKGGAVPGLWGVGIGGQKMVFSNARIDVSLCTQQKVVSSKELQFAVGNLPAMQAIDCNVILGVNVFSKTRFLLSMFSRNAFLQIISWQL